jgi:integrase
MVLRYAPSKTERTSKATVAVDLTLCPMVLEEIANIPIKNRAGPIIVSETTRLPYDEQTYRWHWRHMANAAGLPNTLWARDIRASAVTEGRQAGASTDDAAKLVGHAKPKITAEVYDRDRLEASRRVSKARIENRPKT